MSPAIREKKQEILTKLTLRIDGDVFTDHSTCLMYATDASVYRELPMAVVRPRHEGDIRELVKFASENRIPLIPRGAGTSLAGQVVGNGLVVDISRYMNRILEFNRKDRWVRIQPGVVLDELNLFLQPHGLFFSPETSTSNRCMISGMVGNNSAGSHSLIYGTTRDHVISIRAVLSDSSIVEFKPLSEDDFNAKCTAGTFEGSLYKNIRELLSDGNNQKHIREEFPHPDVIRRNTGYALDSLLNTEPFTGKRNKNQIPDPFNFCKILAGSEGTLAFMTEITLHLVPLPPPEKALICVHLNSVTEAVRANLIALEFKPDAIELMDKTILDCTSENITQRKNRFFIEGDPEAILIIEFARNTKEEILKIKEQIEEKLRNNNLGFSFPIIFGKDINKVWDLRKAGLGVLSNIPGDAKPVAFIEDASVNVKNLENYLKDLEEVFTELQLSSVYYAHISVGEIHIRPVLNLKDPKDVRKFRTLAEKNALLVRKYRGSLSGEHGDGRARSEFIPVVIGDHNYSLIKRIKSTWDPQGIFNPGKIVDPVPMDKSLRYSPGQVTAEPHTIFSFDEAGGILRMAEKCNGSGDCRKSALMGGTMCPSFMATRDENTTTRARANLLRELVGSSDKKNPFDQKELYRILDLCLSCKGCKSECPSNVDMAKMKAEFLQHYYDSNGIPLRTRAIAYISSIQKIGSFLPSLYNFIITNSFFSGIVKKVLGFTENRSIPKLNKVTFSRWCRRNLERLNNNVIKPNGTLYLFIDEFTNYNDAGIGIITVRLLNRLGYKILMSRHQISGRTFLSKGLLRSARKIAIRNINAFQDVVNENIPLVGIEPSAILTFRDEYPDLAGKSLRDEAVALGRNALVLDEFLMREMKAGKISKTLFTSEPKKILFHGHCQQKALISSESIKYVLSFPVNFSVEEIPSGCCGMAGSFGYEKEHFDLSQKVGELILFPAIRNASEDTIISAPGTSCRHQIKDGTGKEAYHPAEILYNSLVLSDQ
jgi:FAD/FMN-containing dehydrogenase/Fe-S oxidoreductase